jgi:hypothetical protein
MSARLGKTQRQVLRALVDHGYFQKGCGWCWSTYNATEKYMQQLVAKGYARPEITSISLPGYTKGKVTYQEFARIRYEPTPEGVAALEPVTA